MRELRLVRVQTPRLRRHRRIRKTVIGHPERPRLCVFRSLKHMYAQVIDDVAGKTLLTVSTLDERIAKTLKSRGNVKAAELLGQTVAVDAKAKGITRVVFDRGGYLYHGRVQALANAARAHGLEF